MTDCRRPQEYSFTLTGGDGSHLHGFCRSFLPPRNKQRDPRTNSNLRYPQVLCIISPYQWFPFYFKVLQLVEVLLKQEDLLIRCCDAELPHSSPAAIFLFSLLDSCRGRLELGYVIRVPIPTTTGSVNVSPPRRLYSPSSSRPEPLLQSNRFIDLQIPPDTGNGSWNAGVPLARLFWHLPVASLMGLLQALLLERRILMVAQEKDTLSAALHAAAALLYPFSWHHIYLPLLPHNLKDYLTAPMPYLIGIAAPHLLTGLKGMGLDDVTVVDLDAGTCRPGPGLPVDHSLLPWSHHLQAAFQVVYQMLRSPTEYESTPLIGHLMQEYFLKLLGSYREFIEVDLPDGDNMPAGPPEPRAGPRLQVQDDGYLRAHGFRFDHLSFVASHRRSEKARTFLDLLRHSQMYEVFINERLALARSGYQTSDAFEAKVSYLHNNRVKMLGKLVNQAGGLGAKGVSNLSAVLHRTSTLVKSGVAQIRQSHSPGEDTGSSRSQCLGRPASLPESPGLHAQSSPQISSDLTRPVPGREEDPTTFFNHDPDAEEDQPAVASPSVSPLRSRSSTRPTSPHIPPDTPTSSGHHLISPLVSPRRQQQRVQLGPASNHGKAFSSWLDLEGVEGSPGGSGASPNPIQQRWTCLMDDDGLAVASSAQSQILNPVGHVESLLSWSLPSMSQAASTVATGWANINQALGLSSASSEEETMSDGTVNDKLRLHARPDMSQMAPVSCNHGSANLSAPVDSPILESSQSATCSQHTPPLSMSLLTIPEPSFDRGRGQPSASLLADPPLLSAETPPGVRSSTASFAGAGYLTSRSLPALQMSGGQHFNSVPRDPFLSLDPLSRTVGTSLPMASLRSQRSNKSRPSSASLEQGQEDKHRIIQKPQSSTDSATQSDAVSLAFDPVRSLSLLDM